MATFPPDLRPSKQDHSVFTIGVVAVLIATLLALPFLAHARPGAQHVPSIAPGSSVPATTR